MDVANNVFRYAVGATYEWSPQWQLRGGAHYDDSPIDAPFRGVGVPDCVADGRATARHVATWLAPPAS